MNTLSEKKILLIILSIGLLARIFLIFFFDDNVRLFNDADSAEYLALAENLRLGNGFTWDKTEPFYPNSFRTPIYPGFLFLARTIFGNYKSALLIQSILVVLSGYILYLIGKKFIDNRRIILGSVGIFMFTPFSLNVSVKFLTQSLFLFLLILAVWSWVSFLKNGRISYLILVSVLLPVLALTRPIAQYLVIIFILSLAVSMYFRQINIGGFSRFLQLSFIMVGILIVGLLPWLVRNYTTFGLFRLSSITAYQMYFYDVPDAYALAKGISHKEAGDLLIKEIDNYSGVSNFGEYMKFTYSDLLMSRSYHYLSEFPFYFAVSRLKNMVKFFLRDGIRYWYNDFNRESRSEINVGKMVTLQEKNLFPYLVVVERLGLAILFAGMIISILYFFKENMPTKSFLVFFFLMLGYFSFFSGVMASAGFRIVTEPIFILVGLRGLGKLSQYVKQ